MTIEPSSYSALELDVMRGLLAVAILHSLEVMRMFPPGSDLGGPVGIGRWLDLRWLLKPQRRLDRLAYVAVAAYAIDRLATVALVYLAVFFIAQVTVRSSRVVANHGHHLVMIVIVAQLCAVGAWNAAERWHWDDPGYLAETQADTMVWWSVQAILAVYFTSGITKLLKSDLGWIHQSPALLVAASSRLETGGAMLVGGKVKMIPRVERLISGFLPHPAVTRVVFAAGLLTELLAPVGLLGENVLLVVGVALVLLHQANHRLLLLAFTSWQLVVFAYLINVPRFFA